MANNKNNRVTLKELFENKVLISKLDLMIDEHRTLQEMTDFANSMEVNVSLGTINNYKKKREEALEKDVPIETLLDKREKVGNIIELKGKESQSKESTVGNEEGTGVYKKAEASLVNVNQILELIMKKGLDSLQQADYVDITVLIKTIAEYNKLNTGNGGLTQAGLQEMRLTQLAYESAIMDVMMKFIPAEKHNEALEYMKDAEDKYYRDLDITEEGRRVRRELDKLGVIG